MLEIIVCQTIIYSLQFVLFSIFTGNGSNGWVKGLKSRYKALISWSHTVLLIVVNKSLAKISSCKCLASFLIFVVLAYLLFFFCKTVFLHAKNKKDVVN